MNACDDCLFCRYRNQRLAAARAAELARQQDAGLAPPSHPGAMDPAPAPRIAVDVPLTHHASAS